MEEGRARNKRHSAKRFENASYFLSKHKSHFDHSPKDYQNFRRIQALAALQSGLTAEAKEILYDVLKENPFSFKTLSLYLFVSLLPTLAARHYSK